MSSLIIKEVIKFLKKKFAADKAAKTGEGEKKAECKSSRVPLFPSPPPPLAYPNDTFRTQKRIKLISLLFLSTATKPVAPVPPPGWTAHLDANANRYYYVETATGKTQWDAPEGTILPPPAAPKAEGEKKPDYLKIAKDFHKKSKGGLPH